MLELKDGLKEITKKSGIKFGFDMDGVICDYDEGILKLIQHQPSGVSKIDLYKHYYMSRSLMFNPKWILGSNDTCIIITGRSKCYADVTEQWLDDHNLDYPLYYCGNGDLCEGMLVDKFFKEIAYEKCLVIEQNDIDIFFEDNPIILDYLRSSTTSCKIVSVKRNILRR